MSEPARLLRLSFGRVFLFPYFALDLQTPVHGLVPRCFVKNFAALLWCSSFAGVALLLVQHLYLLFFLLQILFRLVLHSVDQLQHVVLLGLELHQRTDHFYLKRAVSLHSLPLHPILELLCLPQRVLAELLAAIWRWLVAGCLLHGSLSRV